MDASRLFVWFQKLGCLALTVHLLWWFGRLAMRTMGMSGRRNPLDISYINRKSRAQNHQTHFIRLWTSPRPTQCNYFAANKQTNQPTNQPTNQTNQPNQTKPNQAKPNKTKPNQTKLKQNQTNLN